jgi:hypothetical protein
MPKIDPRVDAYIARSADFAKPILNHLRNLVHATCPQAEETMKWRFPNFLYKGILCQMSAFKNHAAFGFWHRGMRGVRGAKSDERGMGQFGRITSRADLPSDAELKRYIKQAMKLNESGIKPGGTRKPARRLKMPGYFAAALKTSKKASSAFEAMSASHQNEYIEWVTEAKQIQTREKRIATMLQWLAEGKSRNWKYES